MADERYKELSFAILKVLIDKGEKVDEVCSPGGNAMQILAVVKMAVLAVGR